MNADNFNILFLTYIFKRVLLIAKRAHKFRFGVILKWRLWSNYLLQPADIQRHTIQNPLPSSYTKSRYVPSFCIEQYPFENVRKRNRSLWYGQSTNIHTLSNISWSTVDKHLIFLGWVINIIHYICAKFQRHCLRNNRFTRM